MSLMRPTRFSTNDLQFAVGRAFRGAFISLFLPRSAARIWSRALVVFTKRSQLLGRLFPFLREDLHNVAGFQLMFERNERSVHLRARTGVADLGMDGVGEIDRRRAVGRSMTSPCGVTANIRCWKKSTFIACKNSSASVALPVNRSCHVLSCWTQVSSSASFLPETSRPVSSPYKASAPRRHIRFHRAFPSSGSGPRCFFVGADQVVCRLR